MNIVSFSKLSIKIAVVFQLLLVATAQAQLAKLVLPNDPLPAGSEKFSSLYQPRIGEDGGIAFFSSTANGGGGNAGDGLYLVSGGTTFEMARYLHTTPDLNGYFALFPAQSDYALSPYSLAVGTSNNAVFTASLGATLGGGNDDTAIFQFTGSNLVVVAREGQNVPALNGQFGDQLGSMVRINQKNQIAALASVNTGVLRDTLFLYSNGNYKLMQANGTDMPDGNGYIIALWPGALNNNGHLAYPVSINNSSNNSTRGLCLSDGNTTSILVRNRQAVPGGNGNFASFMNATYIFPPAFNDHDQIAFQAVLDTTSGGTADNQGIYTASTGGIVEIARKGQFVPNGNGRYLTFLTYPALNNQGTVVFGANLTGTSGGATDSAGLFASSNGTIKQIVRLGQASPDGNGVFVGFTTPALNDRGEIVFYAALSGTTNGNSDNQGIFLSDADGKLTVVARLSQMVSSNKIVSLDPNNFFTRPNPGGATGFNNQGDITFLTGGAGIVVWSRPSLQPPQFSEGHINIPFTLVADTTNHIEVATSLAGGGNFSDLSGPIYVSGRRGIMTSNFVDTVSNPNQTRFYRVRRDK